MHRRGMEAMDGIPPRPFDDHVTRRLRAQSRLTAFDRRSPVSFEFWAMTGLAFCSYTVRPICAGVAAGSRPPSPRPAEPRDQRATSATGPLGNQTARIRCRRFARRHQLENRRHILRHHIDRSIGWVGAGAEEQRAAIDAGHADGIDQPRRREEAGARIRQPSFHHSFSSGFMKPSYMSFTVMPCR